MTIKYIFLEEKRVERNGVFFISRFVARRILFSSLYINSKGTRKK